MATPAKWIPRLFNLTERFVLMYSINTTDNKNKNYTGQTSKTYLGKDTL